MDKAELARRVKAAAYLEGDFVLRSGKRSKYYLDKYLFETDPVILAELGRRLAEHAADADQIAGAELGGVPLAAATAMACGKSYVIVRNAKKNYGTGKLMEGKLSPGPACCWWRTWPPRAGRCWRRPRCSPRPGRRSRGSSA